MRGVNYTAFCSEGPTGKGGEITVWPHRTSCRREKASKQESGIF